MTLVVSEEMVSLIALCLPWLLSLSVEYNHIIAIRGRVSYTRPFSVVPYTVRFIVKASLHLTCDPGASQDTGVCETS